MTFDIFRKSVEKIQVSLKFTKITSTLHEDLCTFIIICRSVILRMRNVSDKIVEKIKIYILCSITFFQNRAFYEMITEKYCTAGQATDGNITRMRFACWITKATDKHSEYVILIVSSPQQWLDERASKLRLYVHCVSCLLRYQSTVSGQFHILSALLQD
jgi:hypothetical protein